MDMNKAKKTIIIALLLLNAVLLVLNKVYHKSNQLSGQRIDNIVQVYGQNKLLLPHQLPQNVEPVSMIIMESIDNISFEQISGFFEGKDTISRSTVGGKTVFIQGENMVTLLQNGALFESSEGTGSFDGWQEEEIEKFVVQYVNNLNFGFKRLQLYQKDLQEQQGFFLFYEIFEGYPLFSNYVKVYLNQDGIYSVQVHRLVPQGFTGAKRYIYTADEAMLSLMPVLMTRNEAPVVVEQVDFGFHAEKKEGEDLQEEEVFSGNQNVQPYYRVKIKGCQMPYWINAYTNEVKE